MIKRTGNTFLNKLIKDDRGVAAVEFALMLPVLMTLLLGVYELSRFVILTQKIERVAYTASDVVAQLDNVTQAQLDDILEAAADIMQPYEFGPNGIVIISSVFQDPDDGPVVRWQYEGGGSLARDSRIGEVDEFAALPDGFTLNDSDNVIFAEVFYDYIPTFSEDVFASRENYKFAVFKPRFGALTTTPN